MKRRPDLPPRPRGRVARRLTAAAAVGRLELPVCAACRTVQYPLRDICMECLSPEIAWEEVSPLATVLSLTTVRHTTEPYFQARRPLFLGTVKMDAGPVAMVRLVAESAKQGARVRITNQIDRGGESILFAVPEDMREVGNLTGDPNRDVAGKVVLVTGADGGIGRVLVAAFKKAGAAEVIAAGRRPHSGEAEPGVTRIRLDVTDAASVAAAADEVGERVDILVNNAGTTAISGLLDADTMDGARAEMEVNYFGVLSVTRAFAPHMKARGTGVVVNMLTVLSRVCLPSMGSYCASKAAALSLKQGIRGELMPWGVRVVAVFPTTVDTAASTDSPPPKLAPARVASAVVEAIRDGVEDAYPGTIASDLRAALDDNAKVVEHEMGLGLPEPR